MDRPRVVATDIDGTLLRSDGTVSGYTREVLHSVEDLGITVVLVTARPPRWMHELEDLGVHAVALCGNGAFTYDVAAREIVDHRLIEATVVGELVTDLHHGIPGVQLATESLEGFSHEHAWEILDEHGGARRACTVDELGSGAVGKLLVRHGSLATEELTRLVAAVVGERAEVSHSGAVRMTEIGPSGVTKAVALELWCVARVPPVGPDEVWAFGDMPNDLPMLAWAGRSFAVANAHPDVIAAATDTAPSNDDDGVASTLATLLA